MYLMLGGEVVAHFSRGSNLPVATWVEGETLGYRGDSVIQPQGAHVPAWHTKGDWVTGGGGGI